MNEKEKIELADLLKSSLDSNMKLLSRLNPEHLVELLMDQNLERLAVRQKARHEVWASVMQQMLPAFFDIEKKIDTFKKEIGEAMAFVNKFNASFSTTFEKNMNRIQEIIELSNDLRDQAKNGTLGVVLGVVCDHKDDAPFHAMALENTLVSIAQKTTDPDIKKLIVDAIEQHGVAR
jgi:hypothetical protein